MIGKSVFGSWDRGVCVRKCCVAVYTSLNLLIALFDCPWVY